MTLFSFSSLRVRLMLLVLFAVIPALVLILYTASEDRQRERTKVLENALQLARIVSGNQERLIEEGRDLLIGLSLLPEVRSRNADACCKLFADLLKQFPRYANLGVVDPDGNIFCSALLMNRPINISNLPGIKRTIQTRDFTVGTYQIGRITGKPILSLNYPVLDPSGRLKCLIFATLDLTWLNQFATDAKLPTGSTLTLIDRNGTILIRHPNPEKWVAKSMSVAPLVKTILGRQIEGTIEAPGLDGILRLYAFIPLHRATETNAYLIIGIPHKVAFTEVNRILTRNLILLGIVAVLALAAAWVGGNLFILRTVNALLNTTRQLSGGDSDARTGLHYGSDEISQLARAFDQMAEALQTHQTKAKRAEEELKHYAERLKILSRQMMEAQETERRRIARELHDEIGQALTALKINLQVAQRSPEAANLLSYLDENIHIVERLLQQVRDLSLDLRPSMLDDLGLVAALRWYADRQAQRAGLILEFNAEPLKTRLPPELETACFRIAQEALTNVVRHANAHYVVIELHQNEDELQLLIHDDGTGFDVPTAQERAARGASLGLLGMQERAMLAGGQFEIESAPMKGTKIRVRFRLRKD